MQETWFRSLGREDSLEKEMATHSSTLAWGIPWTEELGAGYCPWGCKESSKIERLHFHFHEIVKLFKLIILVKYNAKLFTLVILVKVITTLEGRHCYFCEA